MHRVVLEEEDCRTTASSLLFTTGLLYEEDSTGTRGGYVKHHYTTISLLSLVRMSSLLEYHITGTIAMFRKHTHKSQSPRTRPIFHRRKLDHARGSPRRPRPGRSSHDQEHFLLVFLQSLRSEGAIWERGGTESAGGTESGGAEPQPTSEIRA